MGSLDKLYKSKGIAIGANVISNGILCTIKKIEGLDIKVEGPRGGSMWVAIYDLDEAENNEGNK